MTAEVRLCKISLAPKHEAGVGETGGVMRWTWLDALRLGEELRGEDVREDMRRIRRWLQTQEGKVRAQQRRINALELLAARCRAGRSTREEVEDWT